MVLILGKLLVLFRSNTYKIMIEAFLFFSVSILLVATLIQYTISSSTPPSTKQIPGPKGSHFSRSNEVVTLIDPSQESL